MGDLSIQPISSVSEAEDTYPASGAPSSASETTEHPVYQRRASGIPLRETCPANLSNEGAKATKRRYQVEVTAQW